MKNREHGVGLVLLPKPVQRVDAVQVVREATTGRIVSTVPGVVVRPRPILLPRVWAVAAAPEEVGTPVRELGLGATKLLLLRARDLSVDPVSSSGKEHGLTVAGVPAREEELPQRGEAAAEGDPAFYRRYTEAMLRRYLRLSMAAGRVPSLLGRELFRGHVTSYKVRSFEDVVIFCFDMEKLLGRLEVRDQQLIKRMALQEYTQGEAASMLGLSLRNCIRLYGRALDHLTIMLLEAKMMETQESCQGGWQAGNYGSCTF